MKKTILLLLMVFTVIACENNTANDETEVRESAKAYIIDYYDLPDGTKFTENEMSVTREGNGDADGIYIVKVTITSENRAGERINETHLMQYKKREDAMAAKERWELINFE